MDKKDLKRKIVISVLTGAILILSCADIASAADDTGIGAVLKQSCQNEVIGNMNLYLVKNREGRALNIAFADGEEYVYIRESPEKNSEWTGKLYPGNAVQVLEYLDGWAKIRSGSARGYVPENCLATGKAAREFDMRYDGKRAAVTADVLNVRERKGTGARVLTQIFCGEKYEISGKPENGWYPVIVDGRYGWVSGEYITVEKYYKCAESKKEEEERQRRESAISKGREVVDFACRFIGNPYVWGGTSLTDGADCSGYVQSVYANFGIFLPRTTWDMENAGRPVRFEDALPGDLILYEGHVGLYMGNGNIVNAFDSKRGIVVTGVAYRPIKTVRRVL